MLAFVLTCLSPPAFMLLDTGLPLPLQLSQEVAKRAFLAHVTVPHQGREGDPVALELGEARSVQIGPFELESLPVEVLPRYNIDPDSLTIEGRLGIDAIRGPGEVIVVRDMDGVETTRRLAP